MFLARKIARSKWNPPPEWKNGEIPADAVTGDLRTQNNELSLWRCNGVGDIEEAALAIAAARDHIERLDIVWIASEEFKSDYGSLRDEEGRTPVGDLAKQHVNLSGLDHLRLGEIACLVANAIKGKQCRRLTTRRVKELLRKAKNGGRIDMGKLSGKLRAKIEVL